MTIDVETVCPVCCTIFGPGEIFAERPTCPHCDSEAIDVEPKPLSEFLAGTTLEDLRKFAAAWDAAEGFNPSYKAAKARRIRTLIRRKARAKS